MGDTGCWSTNSMEEPKMSTTTELQQIHMNVRPKTLAQIKELKIMLGTDSQTDTIVSAIRIAEMITKIIKEGGEVIMENKSGKKASLFIPGV